MLKGFDDDSHVETRIPQYEAVNNSKGIHIAEQFVLGKLEGQNNVLRKYGLREYYRRFRCETENIKSESLKTARSKLLTIEGRYTNRSIDSGAKPFPWVLRCRS